MLSAHHNRNNSEVQPLRNSREDIVVSTAATVTINTSQRNNIITGNSHNSSPIHHHHRSGAGGNLNIMGDDTQRILIKIVIDVVLLCCGKYNFIYFIFI